MRLWCIIVLAALLAVDAGARLESRSPRQKRHLHLLFSRPRWGKRPSKSDNCDQREDCNQPTDSNNGTQDVNTGGGGGPHISDTANNNIPGNSSSGGTWNGGTWSSSGGTWSGTHSVPNSQAGYSPGNSWIGAAGSSQGGSSVSGNAGGTWNGGVSGQSAGGGGGSIGSGAVGSWNGYQRPAQGPEYTGSGFSMNTASSVNGPPQTTGQAGTSWNGGYVSGGATTGSSVNQAGLSPTRPITLNGVGNTVGRIPGGFPVPTPSIEQYGGIGNPIRDPNGRVSGKPGGFASSGEQTNGGGGMIGASNDGGVAGRPFIGAGSVSWKPPGNAPHNEVPNSGSVLTSRGEQSNTGTHSGNEGVYGQQGSSSGRTPDWNVANSMAGGGGVGISDSRPPLSSGGPTWSRPAYSGSTYPDGQPQLYRPSDSSQWNTGSSGVANSNSGTYDVTVTGLGGNEPTITESGTWTGNHPHINVNINVDKGKEGVVLGSTSSTLPNPLYPGYDGKENNGQVGVGRGEAGGNVGLGGGSSLTGDYGIPHHVTTGTVITPQQGRDTDSRVIYSNTQTPGGQIDLESRPGQHRHRPGRNHAGSGTNSDGSNSGYENQQPKEEGQRPTYHPGMHVSRPGYSVQGPSGSTGVTQGSRPYPGVPTTGNFPTANSPEPITGVQEHLPSETFPSANGPRPSRVGESASNNPYGGFSYNSQSNANMPTRPDTNNFHRPPGRGNFPEHTSDEGNVDGLPSSSELGTNHNPHISAHLPVPPQVGSFSVNVSSARPHGNFPRPPGLGIIGRLPHERPGIGNSATGTFPRPPSMTVDANVPGGYLSVDRPEPINTGGVTGNLPRPSNFQNSNTGAYPSSNPSGPNGNPGQIPASNGYSASGSFPPRPGRPGRFPGHSQMGGVPVSNADGYAQGNGNSGNFGQSQGFGGAMGSENSHTTGGGQFSGLPGRGSSRPTNEQQGYGNLPGSPSIGGGSVSAGGFQGNFPGTSWGQNSRPSGASLGESIRPGNSQNPLDSVGGGSMGHLPSGNIPRPPRIGESESFPHRPGGHFSSHLPHMPGRPSQVGQPGLSTDTIQQSGNMSPGVGGFTGSSQIGGNNPGLEGNGNMPGGNFMPSAPRPDQCPSGGFSSTNSGQENFPRPPGMGNLPGGHLMGHLPHVGAVLGSIAGRLPRPTLGGSSGALPGASLNPSDTLPGGVANAGLPTQSGVMNSGGMGGNLPRPPGMDSLGNLPRPPGFSGSENLPGALPNMPIPQGSTAGGLTGSLPRPPTLGSGNLPSLPSLPGAGSMSPSGISGSLPGMSVANQAIGGLAGSLPRPPRFGSGGSLPGMNGGLPEIGSGNLSPGGIAGSLPGLGSSGALPGIPGASGILNAAGIAGGGLQGGLPIPQLPSVSGGSQGGLPIPQLPGIGGGSQGGLPIPQLPGIGGGSQGGLPIPQLPSIGGGSQDGLPIPQLPGVSGGSQGGLPIPQLPGIGGGSQGGLPIPQLPGVSGGSQGGLPIPQLPGVSGGSQGGLPIPQLPGIGGGSQGGLPVPQLPGVGGIGSQLGAGGLPGSSVMGGIASNLPQPQGLPVGQIPIGILHPPGLLGGGPSILGGGILRPPSLGIMGLVSRKEAKLSRSSISGLIQRLSNISVHPGLILGGFILPSTEVS